jgi:cellulose biosynthesis protein BcsQ
MRISCIDATAQDRLALKQKLEAAFNSYRGLIGHIETISIVPTSVEEATVQRHPDICVIGPGFNADQAASVCLTLKAHFGRGRANQTTGGSEIPVLPQVPIFVFVPGPVHDLRILRRFEQLATELFRSDEPPARLVHKLLSSAKAASVRTGRTVTIKGVKGGVGATSIAGALAHAAQALGKSAILIDLSPSGSLAVYSGAQRSSSGEFATLLQDNRPLDHRAIMRASITAPNGLNILLPPGLGGEIRGLWLHDSSRFELTLDAIDYLERQFDLVIVDIACAEGILPYALQSRASSRLLVSADEPASVHLLARGLDELRQIPGAGRTNLILNSVARGGLSTRDIVDFLSINEWFESGRYSVAEIPFDSRGRDWIGTGNSFYTESSRSTRRKIEQVLRQGIYEEPLKEPSATRAATIWNRILSGPPKERQSTPRFLKALPEPDKAGRELIQVSLHTETKSQTRTDNGQVPRCYKSVNSSWFGASEALEQCQSMASGDNSARQWSGGNEIYFYRHPQLVTAAEELPSEKFEASDNVQLQALHLNGPKL